MTTALSVVDAFTSEPFAGNPAAVCLLSETQDEAWMQAVAREMNLSETAFLLRRDPPGTPAEGGGWSLRWFTPATEVDLCGHATLASAHVLRLAGLLPAGATARFHTLSGELAARCDEEGWIELDFPSEPPEPLTSPQPTGDLLAALGIESQPPQWVGRNRLDFLLELADEESVRSVDPDFRALAALGARGAIVTARADLPGYDIVSRYFAPAFGIDEDPVTGSAHCCLGPYWADKLGKKQLTGYQASARGGTVRVEVRGDRVALGGQAVLVSRVELLV